MEKKIQESVRTTRSRVRHGQNYAHRGVVRTEKKTGPSQTLPNETMSVAEMLRKHIQGQRIPDTLYREPAYDSGASLDSEDLEKMKHMDLFEKEEYSRQLAVKMEADDKAIKADQKRKQEIRQQEEDELKTLKKQLREKQSEKSGRDQGDSGKQKDQGGQGRAEPSRTKDE